MTRLLPFLRRRAFSTLSHPRPSPSCSTHLYQCNKRIQELTKLGRVDEARQLFDGMPHRDASSWNSMITGYAQNNRLIDARELFGAFPGKNVRTWTALVTGFAKAGRIDEARRVFDSMPERNVISWNAMISGYVQNEDLGSARELFDKMPERNIASWNSMITGYCHACMMAEAKKVFDRTPERNLVSWMVVISGYVQSSCFEQAWDTLKRMHCVGVKSDQSVFVVSLSAVAGLGDFDLIDSLRALILKFGLERDVVVGTAILNAYTRNGFIHSAIDFFNMMPERNEYSWSTMISAFSHCGRLSDAIKLYHEAPELNVASQNAMMTAYAQHGNIQEAKQIFSEIRDPNVITWNAMVSGLAQNGIIDEAVGIFLSMPSRNSTSWAAMISGLEQNGKVEEALDLFNNLLRSGDLPNHSCFTSSLHACANLGAINTGKQIHGLAIKLRYQNNSFIGNGLISMYAKCKNIEDVSLVFSTMGKKDMVSWNSLITGLSVNDMLDDARNTFDKMPERDVVSWTAIISAHVHTGHIDTAIQMFLEMMSREVMPNALTVTSVISACGSAGTSKLGEQIHILVVKLGFDSFLFVNNSLITMYFKCGLDEGFCVLEDMMERDIVTWNAVLAGCAQNGLGNEALMVFQRMQAEGISPNEITFSGVLCACSRAGLLDEGWACFNSMCQDYGIKPLIYHYTCMVDLLGRSGQLNEAKELIESMPMEPDSVIWEALLGACKIHRNFELGEKVAKKLFDMEAHGSGTYVLLSNMYASQGKWDEVRETRQQMKAKRVSKEPGISWIQIKGKLYSFLNGDKAHDRFQEICLILREYRERLKLLGYVCETSCVLHDVEEEQKEDDLLYHSEKLAVAFALLTTPKGLPIQIMKNLRICGDCHSFMKFMSIVSERKIIVRDGARFHHFQGGSCTCRDYW